MAKVGKRRKGRRKKEIKKKEQRQKGRGIRNKTSLILFSLLLPQIIYSIDLFVSNHIFASLRINVFCREHPSNTGIRRYSHKRVPRNFFA